MTSLQSQYLLRHPLACNTARTPLGIDRSTNTVLWNSPPFLLKNLLQFLQNLRCWLSTVHASIQIIPQMFYWVQIWWFRRPGSTLTFWLARKSTVARAVCGRALSCWQTSLRRFIAGSMWCQNLISVSNGAKVAGDGHQLSFSGVGYGTPHHHFPPTKLSTWRTQFLAILSFRRL